MAKDEFPAEEPPPTEVPPDPIFVFNPMESVKEELKIAKKDAADAEVYTKIVDWIWFLAATPEEIDEVLDTVSTLVHGKNLAPLTDNPDEWEPVTRSLYRNKRNQKAFTSNGAQTYWLVDERQENNTFPQHTPLHQEPTTKEND